RPFRCLDIRHRPALVPERLRRMARLWPTLARDHYLGGVHWLNFSADFTETPWPVIIDRELLRRRSMKASSGIKLHDLAAVPELLNTFHCSSISPSDRFGIVTSNGKIHREFRVPSLHWQYRRRLGRRVGLHPQISWQLLYPHPKRRQSRASPQPSDK